MDQTTLSHSSDLELHAAKLSLIDPELFVNCWIGVRYGFYDANVHEVPDYVIATVTIDAYNELVCEAQASGKPVTKDNMKDIRNTVRCSTRRAVEQFKKRQAKEQHSTNIRRKLLFLLVFSGTLLGLFLLR